MILPNAVVLRVAGGAAPALQALDLRNPDQPQLSEPIPMDVPATGRVLSAFASGASIYYTYLVPTPPAEAQAPSEAHFYFRTIDFSNPAQPSAHAAVNVPGQLVAVAGDDLYTREFVRKEGKFETLVHRLVVRDGRAVREATGSLGDRMAVALQLDGEGRLLVDLREQLEPFFNKEYQWPTTDLAILDARTLGRLGQTRVGPQARRLALHQGRLSYDLEGLVIVGARVPSAPAVQAYLPLLDHVAPRVQAANGSLLVQDRHSIEHIDLNLANLLP